MKLKTNITFKGLDGKEYIENEKPVLVSQIICNTLSLNKSTDPFKSYKLAKQFATDKEVELTSEDIVFIKEAFKESTLPALFVGQIIEALEA